MAASVCNVNKFRTILVQTKFLYGAIGIASKYSSPGLKHKTLNSCFNSFLFGCISLQTRNTSFFNRLKADQIWKGVISVSNAGKKRGRGKGTGKITAKNLNRGQIIGIGEKNMVWPGLNAPIVKGKEIVEMQQLPPNPERQNNLIKMRDSIPRFRLLKLTPLERGWSGTKFAGRSLGAPDAIGEDTFEGFDTKCLEFKTVTNMTGLTGRVKSLSAFCVTGNRNGLAGYALAKAPTGGSALRRSKNSAASKLVYIERFNGHTVYHNFYAKYGRTKIFVYKKPRGHGLVCHRAIKSICQIIGIKDLYAKVEGNTKNIQNLTRAFFFGLVNQKTHQKLANETGLHIIELRAENEFFPTVVAKPQEGVKVKTMENMPEFREYISEGRVALRRKKWPPFYTKLPGWKYHLKKTLYRRNHEKVKLEMQSELGSIKSFLSDLPASELPVIKGITAFKEKDK